MNNYAPKMIVITPSQTSSLDYSSGFDAHQVAATFIAGQDSELIKILSANVHAVAEIHQRNDYYQTR